MHSLVILIYQWTLYPLIHLLFGAYALFSSKARRTLALRSRYLKENFEGRYESWVHVSSAGELEYAIPLIQELLATSSGVILTYYSTSAEKPAESLKQKNLKVCPLPHDGYHCMASFVHSLKSVGVKNLILVKYDLWPAMLYFSQKSGIKIYITNKLKFRVLGNLLHSIFCRIYYSYEREKQGFKNERHGGDTRIPRILERIVKQERRLPEDVIAFIAKDLSVRSSKVLMLGSAWGSDLQLFDDKCLLELFKNQVHVYCVPHELDMAFTKQFLKNAASAGYAVFDENQNPKDNLNSKISLRIIRKKGILLELYAKADWVYVGGGFNKNVHSVLEPALQNKWVACGPARERAPETYDLESLGLLHIVSEPKSMMPWIKSTQGIPYPEKILHSFIDQSINSHKNIVSDIKKDCL